ncbi:MAG TPA: FKBP-type peptidyl-prolyl cis-trans isomerase [Verrucomicrobiae bacterium]|nr:FKBP-type peptidyl-prolyl cis-trans isomerase [Verrucomicrobiae bacterium]
MFTMKTTILTIVFSLTVAAPLLAADTNVLSDEKSRASYAIGMMLGTRWRANNITDLNYDLVLRGMKDAEAGGATLLNQQEMGQTLTQFQQTLAAQAAKQREEVAATNKLAGDAYLAQNRQKPGVVTLPDGLQYKVLTDGTGESPTANDTVTVSYDGTLIDGTRFDSSSKAQFRVGGVIPGWSEALTHMKVGSKWQLFIPSDLAYGSYGRPPRIGPGSVLIFTVDLIAVEHPQPITSDIIKVPSAEDMKNGAKVQIIKPEDLQKAQQSSQPAQ